MKIARIKQATSKGYIEMKVGGVFDATYPNSKTRRGRVQDALQTNITERNIHGNPSRVS